MDLDWPDIIFGGSATPGVGHGFVLCPGEVFDWGNGRGVWKGGCPGFWRWPKQPDMCLCTDEKVLKSSHGLWIAEGKG